MTESIILDDIKLYKAEDQTDSDSGGGLPGPLTVIDGKMNNLFPNISRVDRLNGRIQLRKIFPAITSDNTEVYSGGHVIIKEIPEDPQVSVLLFDTYNFADTLDEKKKEIETFYQASTPVGNAGLDADVSVGSTQLVFKTLHYEYTPKYDSQGKLVYISKIDARYTCNISVGDLLVLEENNTSEFIQVKEIQKVHEELDNSSKKHYYIVDYLVVTLSYPLENNFSKGVIPKRTTLNTSWKCYGTTTLAEEAKIDDSYLVVESDRVRLAPVIEKKVQVSEQHFFNYPVINSTYNLTIEDDINIDLTLNNVEQTPCSEAFDSVLNKKSYVFNLEHTPIQLGTVEVWYFSNKGWWVLTDSNVAGTFAGDGTGTITSDGLLQVNFNYFPDENSKIIVLFNRQYQYKTIEYLDITDPLTEAKNKVFALASEEASIDMELGDNVIPQTVSIHVDQGASWELLGTDIGGGIITGNNIDICTINYSQGNISLTLKAVYTQGVTLKVDYKARSTDQETLYFVNKTKLSFSPIQKVQKTYLTPNTILFSFSKTRLYYDRTTYTWQAETITYCSGQDDGAGNLYVDDNKIGSINYDTGDFSWDQVAIETFYPDLYQSYIAGTQIDVAIKGYYYPNTPLNSNVIPYYFSSKHTNIIPNSLVIKYFTAENSGVPYFLTDDGNGALLVYSPTPSFTEVPQVTVSYNARPCAMCSIDDVTFCAFSGHKADVGRRPVDIGTSLTGETWSINTNVLGNNWYIYGMDGNTTVLVICGDSDSGNNIAYSNDSGATFTPLSLGSGTETVYDVKWVSQLNLFIAITSNNVYTSSDGISWGEQVAVASNMRKIIVGTYNGNPRIVILANSGGAYSDDLFSWNPCNCKITNVNDGDFQESNGTFWAVGDTIALTFSDNGGQSWQSISVSDTLTTDYNLMDISTGGGGAILILANKNYTTSYFTFIFSTDNGKTWNDLGKISTTSYIPFIAFHNKVDKFMFLQGITTGGASHTVQVFVADYPYVPYLEMGTINYETGIGSIEKGNVPTNIIIRHLLINATDIQYVVTTKGAVPIQDNSFICTAKNIEYKTLILSEDPNNPGTLIGQGEGNIDNESGVAFIKFEEAILPETIELFYSYGSLFHPSYKEISTRGLPMDGLVPIIQVGDVIVVKDDTNEEMLTVISTAGGLIRVAQTLKNNYQPGALVCSALFMGDLTSYMAETFTLAAWNGYDWIDKDDYVGSPANDVYNWASHPLQLTNAGAITERFIIDIVQVDPILVDVIGENVGTLLSNHPITLDIAPINPNTGYPYWILSKDGWPVDGGNFQFGEAIRFNTVGAIHPVWVARVVNAGGSQIIDDSCAIEVRGDVGVTTTTVYPQSVTTTTV